MIYLCWVTSKNNFDKLYPIIYFYLSENKLDLTNGPKKLYFLYRLSQGACHNYSIYAGLNNEMRINTVSGELIVV